MSESRLKSPENDALFEAILKLETEEECYRFFEDICTISELKSIAQRLAVAKLLRENVTYQDISAQLGASTATISRVNRALTYGTGGYGIVLDRIAEEASEGKEP